jgi:hypothetical protein
MILKQKQKQILARQYLHIESTCLPLMQRMRNGLIKDLQFLGRL